MWGPAAGGHMALMTIWEAGRHHFQFMACTERHQHGVQHGSVAVCPASTSSPPQSPVKGAREGLGAPCTSLRLPWGWGTSASSVGDKQVGDARCRGNGITCQKAGEGHLPNAAQARSCSARQAQWILGEGACASTSPCAPLRSRGLSRIPPGCPS